MGRVKATASIATSFGAEVRRRRDAQGLTLPELGERSGLTPNYIGGVELGGRDPSLSTILALARGLGVSPGELVERSDELSQAALEAGRAFEEMPPDVQDSVRKLLVTIAALHPKKPTR